MDYVIVKASPDSDNFTVRLAWKHGAETVADFSDIVGRGVFAPMADPAFFAKVKIGDAGNCIEWPGGLDFCADALWYQAHPKDNPYVAGNAAE